MGLKTPSRAIPGRTQEDINVWVGKAGRSPLAIGGLEGFAVVTFVAGPEKVSVCTAQHARPVGFPEEPKLEVAHKMPGVNRAFIAEQGGKECRGPAKFRRIGSSVDEVEGGQPP